MAIKITLGKKYRDRVSGWEGIAAARYEYMNGCVRINLEACDKDGEPKGYVFDSEQIEPVKDAKPVTVARKKTGGPPISTPVPR